MEGIGDGNSAKSQDKRGRELGEKASNATKGSNNSYDEHENSRGIQDRRREESIARTAGIMLILMLR